MLSGCTIETTGGIPFRTYNGFMQFTVCTSIDAVRITAQSKPADSDAALETTWRATGLAKLTAGTILSWGQVTGLDTIETHELSDDPNTLVTVTLSSEEKASAMTTSFTLGQLSALQSGQWLQNDGSVTTEACPTD